MPSGNRSQSSAGTVFSSALSRRSRKRLGWYSTGLPAVPLRWVLIRDSKEECETQALLCTDLHAPPELIISWFVRRWQMERTFQEVRQRLGLETQRHWSERAIRKTAPALLGLFSVITLLANRYM